MVSNGGFLGRADGRGGVAGEGGRAVQRSRRGAAAHFCFLGVLFFKHWVVLRRVLRDCGQRDRGASAGGGVGM